MEHNLKSRQSLRFSVISRLFALIIFLLIALGLYQYNVIEGQASQRYDSDQRIAIGYFSTALKQAIWEFDEPLIDELVEAQSNIDSLIGLTVPGLNTNDNPVYIRNEQGILVRILGAKIPTNYTSKTTLNLTYTGREIGTIVLHFDEKFYLRQARKEFTTLLIQISTLALILLFVFYYFINGFVVKPISQLYHSVESMGKWKDTSSDIQKNLPDNEIRLLAAKYADVYRELNKHREHLEVLVEQRTESLQEANENLVDEISIRKKSEHHMAVAKKEAQEADRAKSRFLSHITHELRTPLNGILGYAQILGDQKLPKKEKQYTAHILRCSLHLLELINNILDYNKLETVSSETNPTPNSLAYLMDEIKTIVYPRCESKNLEFELLVSSDLPKLVDVDSGKLKQILVNLLANAIKFTKQGYSRLVIEVASPGEYLFSVMDSGQGIPADEQANIFDAYVQSTQIETTDASTGLGLSISKSLVDSMGGSLQLQSEFGTGSQFFFTLKLTTSMQSESIKEGKIASFKDSEKMTILIVDDNKDNLFILQKVLEKVGFAVVPAISAQIAFEEIEKQIPAMIFMDVHMPEMDGTEATTLIKKRHPTLPVVAFTANIYDELDPDSKMKCFDGFVYKPVNRQAIYQVISETLDVIPIYQK